jgi:hypothetical protein
MHSTVVWVKLAKIIAEMMTRWEQFQCATAALGNVPG